MSTTGLDLLAEGGTITLTDNTKIALRYSFRALALLEARFGSVTAVQNVLDASGSKPAFGPLAQILGAATVGPGGFEPHIREYQDAKGERHISEIVYRRAKDGMDLSDLLHPGLLGEYVEAFSSAFSVALASLGNDEGAGPVTLDLPVMTTNSPGLTATTSPSVPSTFLPASSGT